MGGTIPHCPPLSSFLARCNPVAQSHVHPCTHSPRHTPSHPRDHTHPQNHTSVQPPRPIATRAPSRSATFHSPTQPLSLTVPHPAQASPLHPRPARSISHRSIVAQPNPSQSIPARSRPVAFVWTTNRCRNWTNIGPKFDRYLDHTLELDRALFPCRCVCVTFGQPPSHPSAQPSSQPTSHPVTHPLSHPAAPPPIIHPATQPIGHSSARSPCQLLGVGWHGHRLDVAS